MKAQVYITERVKGVFAGECESEGKSAVFGKPILEAVVQSVQDMVYKERLTRPHADKVIIAGNRRDGFLDISDIELEGILPYMGATYYNYGEDNKILSIVLSKLGRDVERGTADGDLLVLASSLEAANICIPVLQEVEYTIQTVL